MENKILIRELCIHAKAALDACDPEKCVVILHAAQDLCNDEEMRRQIYKAREEADIGSVEKAEILLGLLV